jgi:hypothetical protein
MPPVPYVFRNVQELHNLILDTSVNEHLSGFTSKRVRSIRELVVCSVVQNTFRAFHFKSHGIGQKPSEIYRNLATEKLENEYKNIIACNSFEELIDKMIEISTMLDNDWYELTGKISEVRIGFGRAAKLLGLSVKHLLWYSELTEDDRIRLLKFLNVPLDSYTLQGIRIVAPDLQIPKNATMKFVRDKQHYQQIQNRILTLMPVGRFPIHYEIAAYNLAHPHTV